MDKDSDSELSSDSSNNSSTFHDDTESEALAARKAQSDGDDCVVTVNNAQNPDDDTRTTRGNASTKGARGSGSDSIEKSGGKTSSVGNEVPSVDEVSIPRSVDPDAPANTEGDNSDDSTNSDGSE